MKLETYSIKLETEGNNEIINLTPYLEKLIKDKKIENAILFLSVIGSTAAITTMEFEPGLIKDLKDTLEKLFPFSKNYVHNLTWSDYNSHSHLRSSFLKTCFFISVSDGNLDLGTWQQVVLIDFDIRKRERKVVIKILSDAIK